MYCQSVKAIPLAALLLFACSDPAPSPPPDADTSPDAESTVYCESFGSFPPDCYWGEVCQTTTPRCDYERICAEWDDCGPKGDTSCFQCRIKFFCNCG